MLVNVELLVQSILLKLLESKIKFHFVSSVFNYLENPKSQAFLAIAQFHKEGYILIKEDLEKLIPEIEKLDRENKGYRNAFLTIVSSTLSDYSYTFTDISNNLVQSNLLFLLMKTLNNTCIAGLINYLCEKDLWEVFSFPQIYSSSYIFSSIIHKLLEKKLDALAVKCAMHFDNKSLLFVKDFSGFTPFDIAMANECSLSLEYFKKLKEIGEAVGIFAKS